MRKHVGRITAFLLGALLVAAILPWSVSDTLLREPMIAQIKAQIGLQTEAAGRVTIAILPRPRLKFEDVTIRDKAGALVLEARAVKGDLRLLSLLSGRLELKSLSFDTPTLFVDMDGHPFEQGGAIARALQTVAGSPAASEADRARLASVTISSGLIRLKSKAHGFETLVQDVNATLDWQRLGDPALLSGNAVWRGQPADFDVAIARPAALLRGEQSGATLRLRGVADIDASGLLSGSPRTQFEGTMTAATTSLRQIARITDMMIPLPGPLGNASISGDVSATGPKFLFTNAKMDLDDNSFEGSLALDTSEGRASLSGTLATDLLQLDAIVGELPALRGSDGQWSRDTLVLKDLAQAELDLRISAARLRLGGLQGEDAALSVLLKDGRLEVALAEAQAYRGSVKARAIATLANPGLDIKLNGSFAQLDANAFLTSAFGTGWISGLSSGQFSLQNGSDSPAGLVAGLEGHAQVTVSQGSINGINVEQALRRVEKHPLLSASDIHNGRTSFDQATAGVKVEHGVAQIAAGTIVGPGAHIAFQGNASIADRTMQLKAHATQTSNAAGPQLDFQVSGSWDDLRVEPDAEGLIRRSDAAAPLFGSRRNEEAAPVMLHSTPSEIPPPLP